MRPPCTGLMPLKALSREADSGNSLSRSSPPPQQPSAWSSYAPHSTRQALSKPTWFWSLQLSRPVLWVSAWPAGRWTSKSFGSVWRVTFPCHPLIWPFCSCEADASCSFGTAWQCCRPRLFRHTFAVRWLQTTKTVRYRRKVWLWGFSDHPRHRMGWTLKFLSFRLGPDVWVLSRTCVMRWNLPWGTSSKVNCDYMGKNVVFFE